MDYGMIAYAEIESIKLKLYEITERLQALEKEKEDAKESV
jgi:hypothetical protein